MAHQYLNTQCIAQRVDPYQRRITCSRQPQIQAIFEGHTDQANHTRDDLVTPQLDRSRWDPRDGSASSPTLTEEGQGGGGEVRG